MLTDHIFFCTARMSGSGSQGPILQAIKQTHGTQTEVVTEKENAKETIQELKIA